MTLIAEWYNGRGYLFIELKARTSERMQPRKGKKKSRDGCGPFGDVLYLFYIGMDHSSLMSVSALNK